MAKRGTPIERLRAWEPKGIERYVDGMPHFHPKDVERIVSIVGIPIPSGRMSVNVNDGGTPADRFIERSEALKQKLDEFAMWYEIEARDQERPDGRDVRDALGEIGQHAEALLRALSVIPQLPKDSRLRHARLHLESTPAPLAIDYERMDYSILGPLQSQAAICAQQRDGLGMLEIFRIGDRTAKFADQIAGRTALRASVDAIRLLRNWARAAQSRASLRAEARVPRGRRADEALNGLFGNLKGLWMDIWERAPKASRPKLLARGNGVSEGSPFFRFCKTVSEHLKLGLTEDGIYDRIRMATARRRRRREGKSGQPAS